ncbi:MAG: ATP-dependent DNA helicase RecG [Provencibacterium sp.]|nr:ATP-dependent DNA helicase RecG [Provencibacterium sp.]
MHGPFLYIKEGTILDLNTDIQYCKGVGPVRAQLYHHLDIRTLRDLCYHFPRDYLDLTAVTPCADCKPGTEAAVRGAVLRKKPEARLRKGLTLYRLSAADESGELTITFFNNRYAFEALKIGEEYLFYGQIRLSGARPEMTSPLVFPAGEAGGLLPVYPLTAGLTSKGVSGNIRQALAAIREQLADPIPPDIRSRYQLCELGFALQSIHFPSDAHALSLARERLIFEELFILSIALRRVRSERKKESPVRICGFQPEAFYQSLPFSPTGAQRRAVEAILSDLSSGTPMNRLLQGDVGSGKTLVAAAACLAAVQSGYQCAVMAPTEILAGQHAASFAAFLKPFGVQVTLLTGSMKAKDRRQALAALQSGETGVAIGTHALLTADVSFQNLGLAITDEQHRFGVRQRVMLREKSGDPHILVMSATPIPRTLALMIYGDLDVTLLDELPPGRQRVETYCIPSSKLERAYGFVRAQLDRGRQAYLVCPLVSEEEETSGLPSAEKTARELGEGPFAGYRTGVLHGKLKPAEKDRIMRAFKEGEIQLLVCTTVVEVGVDVPNATVMICMAAERFGLSQLHQLRGRVGRGRESSSCILVSDARGETARARLKAMCETNDGFQIAEFDLRQRGPGDFFGGRQHGLPRMRIADMARDNRLLANVQQAAGELLREDPELERADHAALRESCGRLAASIGDRPN